MKAVDELIIDVMKISNPTYINRFRTMMCLINELDLSPVHYKETSYWKSLKQPFREIINHSRNGGYQEVKAKLKKASETRMKRADATEGVNISRVLLSYFHPLRLANDPTSVNIDKLPVASSKKRRGPDAIHYKKTLDLLEEIKPQIKAIQSGKTIYSRSYGSIKSKALHIYSSLIYGEKKLSNLEKEALKLLPNRAGKGFVKQIMQELDEKKRKRIIFYRLKKAYGKG